VVNLNEVVHDAIRLLGHDAMLRQVSIKFELFPGLPPVLGDRVQLYQVVLNLLMNGFEAVTEPMASDRWELVRTAELDDGWVELTVEDSGRGLPKAIWPACLNRFLAPSRMVWGWGSRLAGRSCKRTVGGFGPRRT